MAGRFTVEAIFKAIDKITAPVTRMQNSVGKFSRNVERGLRRTDRAMGKVSRTAAVGAGAIGVAAGATAIALKGVADKADALAKQSRRLQFDIGALQEWKFVAEQSGLTTELFDKSLDAFTKRVGEAKSGTGQLASFLKKTNPVLLEQLEATSDVSQAMDLYLKAMGAVEDPMQRAAFASAAFSRTGLKMANITDNSVATIAALRREQRENGLITLEQARHAEAWNDAMNSLGRAIDGFRISVLSPLFPMLTDLARQSRTWVIANREIVSEKVKRFLVSLHQNFERVIKVMKQIGIGLAVFITFIAILKTFVLIMTAVNLVMTANPIALIVVGIGLMIAAISAAIIWWDEFKAVMLRFAETVWGKFQTLAGWIARAFDGLPGPVKKALDLVASLFSPFTALMKFALSGVFQLLSSIPERFTRAAKQVMQAWEPVKGFFKSLWTGISNVFSTAVDHVGGAVDRLTSVVSPVFEMIKNVNKVALNPLGEIRDQLSNVGGHISNGVSRIGSLLGFNNDDEQQQASNTPQIIPPQERVARIIEESRSTSNAEITIRPESGTTADLTAGQLTSGIKLAQSGTF